MKGIIVILSGQVFIGSLKTFLGRWGPRNIFAERIEKPVRTIGPPLVNLLFLQTDSIFCTFCTLIETLIYEVVLVYQTLIFRESNLLPRSRS